MEGFFCYELGGGGGLYSVGCKEGPIFGILW